MAEQLTKFEGIDVIATGIEIPNAGGGLNAAMKIDPVEYHKGQKLRVLLDVEVTKIRFEPVKDTNGLRRVHVAPSSLAVVVPDEFGQAEMDEQARRIEEARIKPGELDEALLSQHAEGGHHEGLVEGCAACQKEADALAEEAASGEA